MVNYTLDQIAKATKGSLAYGDPGLKITGVTTDSRRVNSGELFIALKGENFNGHHFIEQAVRAGAAAVMVMEEQSPVNDNTGLIKVADTLIALGQLARFHRSQFKIPVIGITGSNGKTTTKDMVAAVLEQELAVVKTEANYNNEIGLPFTLFKIDSTTQGAVVEMGMRGLGQIANLAKLAQPNLGIITNIGLTHLELLGSQANIAAAKGELVASLPAGGVAILNGDDPWLRSLQPPSGVKVVYYGIESPDLDYRAVGINSTANQASYRVDYRRGAIDIKLPLPGLHNVSNSLAAVAVAKELGISDRSIQTGLAELVLTDKRLKFIKTNKFTIIDDTYNASPTSIKAALDVLKGSNDSGRTIAVLADMLELGETTETIHYEVGTYAGNIGIDHLFAFGEAAQQYVEGINSISQAKGEYFSNKSNLISRLKEFIRDQDTVLVKGSRGMAMEEVVEALTGGDEV